ncbi:MAG TPA: hypothetical protein VFW30_11590 [Bryocella sp.]|nr:hypothetical protein [Bryocella sp.]
MPSSVFISLGDDLVVVCGRKQVLELAPALQELTRRTGQLGAMHWLEYFLYTPSLASKPPYLVLQLRSAPSEELHADDVLAAALFFEYRIAGLRTRVFSTDDAVGFRSVIAAPDERRRFAERAAYALLRSGAHIVLATHEIQDQSGAAPASVPGALLGYRERRVSRMLTLAPSFEETLARMGRLTRRNLRYYRRHLASRMQVEFVADAGAQVSFAQFKALDHSSLNPVGNEKELWLRWRGSCEVDGGFLAGLRTANGKWLSLLGGWRHDTTTVVHWQLNSAGYEHDSIGIVIRSFFLEHEIANGARKLLMFGGTPHSIRYAFDEDAIADLILCRPTVRSTVLRILARSLVRHSRRARTNHLLQTLAEVPLSTQTGLCAEGSNTVRKRTAANLAGRAM